MYSMEHKKRPKIQVIPHTFDGLRWTWHGIEVKRSVQSEHAGLGVFATQTLPEKERVALLWKTHQRGTISRA